MNNLLNKNLKNIFKWLFKNLKLNIIYNLNLMENEYMQTYSLLRNQKTQYIDQLEKEIDVNKKELLLKEIIMIDENLGKYDKLIKTQTIEKLRKFYITLILIIGKILILKITT